MSIFGRDVFTLAFLGTTVKQDHNAIPVPTKEHSVSRLEINVAVIKC
jgi:hypothetical protein